MLAMDDHAVAQSEYGGVVLSVQGGFIDDRGVGSSGPSRTVQ